MLTIFKENDEYGPEHEFYFSDSYLGSNNDANIDSQRIKDLEIELRERLEIEADNNKLKQENAALIRIISKLSK